VLLPRVDRTRLSHLRLHNRLGTCPSRRVRSRGAGQLGWNVALCGRRSRFAVVAAGGELGTLASLASDGSAAASDQLCMAGGRRSRLAPQSVDGVVREE